MLKVLDNGETVRKSTIVRKISEVIKDFVLFHKITTTILLLY